MTRVVIFATSKSGSSVTTRIFHEHGLWVGSYNSKNGYPSYENNDIKGSMPQMVHRHKDGNGQRILRTDIGNVRRLIRENFPADNWVAKVGIDWWNVWHGLFDGLSYVFVKRSIEGVAQSLHNKHGRDLQRSRIMVERRYLAMDSLSKKYDVPIVMTDELIAGDYSSIESAMSKCGMKFDARIADRCIDRKKWHY